MGLHVTRFGALPGPSSGGTFSAYFGYPMAAESDARDAIRFGIAFRNGIAMLSEQTASAMGASPAVCVGIHTGIALVGEEDGAYQVHGNIDHVTVRIADAVALGSIVTRRMPAGLG